MTTAEMQSVQVTGELGGRPTDEELDFFGITHEGKVRPDNQDHFMIATIHPQIVVHGTSLPDADNLPLRGGRFGTFALVADGVGGAAAGSDAARLATESVTRYVSSLMRSYHHLRSGSTDADWLRELKESAMQAHDAVRAEAASRPEQKKMATTLTMILAAWPWMYVVQVGDSRCYILQDGKLKQITRDQTIAQQLVDDGAMKAEHLARSPLRNVLASAIGADEALPEVTRVDVTSRPAVMLCSDGLTKHVKDLEIEERLVKATSSEQVCRELLELALERGGSDNITIVLARAPQKARRPAYQA